MGDISQWSSDANTGYQITEPPPDGAPENHSASQTNNIMRETMAASRRQWEQKEWFDFGDPPTFLTSSSFRIADTYAEQYLAGRRVRATVSGAFNYGTVASVSPGVGTIDVTLTMDIGSALTAGLTIVELGSTPLSVPNLGSGSIPDPLQLNANSAATPTYSYADAIDTGMYFNAGSVRISVDGSDALQVGVTENESLLVMKTPAGSVSAPGLAVGESDQGLYEVTTDTLGVSAAGTLAAGFDSAGTYFPNGDATNPGLSFAQRNVGLFAGVNTLGFTANGVDAMRIGTGRVEPKVPLWVPDGSESDPSIAFANATDTGFFWDSATNREISVTIDGTRVAYFPSNEPGSLKMPNVGTDDAQLVLGAGDQFSGVLMASRSGAGVSSDPNGLLIVGRNAAGTSWAYGEAIRWSHSDQAWYIGTADHDPDKDILTRGQIQALINAA